MRNLSNSKIPKLISESSNENIHFKNNDLMKCKSNEYNDYYIDNMESSNEFVGNKFDMPNKRIQSSKNQLSTQLRNRNKNTDHNSTNNDINTELINNDNVLNSNISNSNSRQSNSISNLRSNISNKIKA